MYMNVCPFLRALLKNTFFMDILNYFLELFLTAFKVFKSGPVYE